MIFDAVTGTTTAYTSTTITDSSAAFVVDFYRGWTVAVDSVEYDIVSNTETTLTISSANLMASNDTYSINFLTRATLAKIDDKASNITYFPNALVTSKINQTYIDFEQKIYAKYKYLLTSFTDGELPQDYVYNLFRLKQTMSYYCLESMYIDAAIQDNDFALYRAEYSRKKYRDTLENSLGLLAVDVDKTGAYTNKELGTKFTGSIYLSR